MVTSVGIVEDDPHFMEMLEATFVESHGFEVTRRFTSTTALLTEIPISMSAAQEFVPDLLVVDSFAFGGTSHPNEVSPDGITMSIYLRRCGLRFASLVITSLDVRMIRIRFGDELGPGWEFLQKQSSLEIDDIRDAARRCVASLRTP